MTKKDDKDLLKLGRQMAVILDMSRADRKTMMYNSFLRGMAQGFGVVIGGTILVAFLLWMLGFFDQVPFLEKFVNAVIDVVKQNY